MRDFNRSVEKLLEKPLFSVEFQLAQSHTGVTVFEQATCLTISTETCDKAVQKNQPSFPQASADFLLKAAWFLLTADEKQRLFLASTILPR